MIGFKIDDNAHNMGLIAHCLLMTKIWRQFIWPAYYNASFNWNVYLLSYRFHKIFNLIYWNASMKVDQLLCDCDLWQKNKSNAINICLHNVFCFVLLMKCLCAHVIVANNWYLFIVQIGSNWLNWKTSSFARANFIIFYASNVIFHLIVSNTIKYK